MPYIARLILGLEGGKPMSIMRWNPWNDVSALQDRINQLFDNTFPASKGDRLSGGEWNPVVDVFDTEDAVIDILGSGRPQPFLSQKNRQVPSRWASSIPPSLLESALPVSWRNHEPAPPVFCRMPMLRCLWRQARSYLCRYRMLHGRLSWALCQALPPNRENGSLNRLPAQSGHILLPHHIAKLFPLACVTP